MKEGLACKTTEELSELLSELLGVAKVRGELRAIVKEECGEFLRNMRTEELRDHLAQAALESAFSRIKRGSLALQ